MEAQLRTAQKLKGFQDVDPQAMLRQKRCIDVIERQAALAGFGRLQTPCLEYAHSLLGVGGETDKQVYRFRDNGDREVCLRFDLTLPLARYVAENYHKLAFPARFLQLGQVWRAEKPQAGRYREFLQVDCDIVGSDSPASDADIVLLAARSVAELHPKGAQIRIGNRALVNEALRLVVGEGVPVGPLLIALDKMDKIGREACVSLMATQGGLDRATAAQLVELLCAWSQGEHAAALPADRRVLWERHLATLDAVQQAVPPCIDVVSDFTVVRGLGYYTGMVFETFLREQEGLGSVCSGGRYDGLTQRFLPDSVPCVGMSVGVSRLMAADETKAGLRCNAVVMFCDPGADLAAALRCAVSGRDQGSEVHFDYKERKLGHYYKNADRSGACAVVRWSLGEVRVKNLSTGVEEVLSLDEATWDRILGFVPQAGGLLGVSG